MTAPMGPMSAVATPDASPRAREAERLRETAAQLEGLFVRQLFAAMRATVPTDGITGGGAGEEMFTAMLHEELADVVPTRWERGLAREVLASFDRAGADAAATPMPADAPIARHP